MKSEIPPSVIRAHQAKQKNEQIIAQLQTLGGVLRCKECGNEKPLGNVGQHLQNGWPQCCGKTMTWITSKQL